MKAWVRRQVDQLCQHANASFSDVNIGGFPADEFFGATGLAGVSESASASDHRHAMPDIEDLLDDVAFFFDDALGNTPSQFYNIGAALTTPGGRDDVGAYGAFGSFDIRTTNALTGSAGAMLQNQGAVSTSAQIHLWQRVQELTCRCSPGIASTDIDRCLVSVGGMRSSVATFGAGAVVAGITDGVYFLLTTDVAGAGNWFAVANNNGTSTSVDTGVAVVTDGSNIGFQNFKINYDHATTTAVYSIDDVQVATISSNIPPSTRKLAGFGAWIQSLTTGVARQINLSFDRLSYVGARVAT